MHPSSYQTPYHDQFFSELDDFSSRSAQEIVPLLLAMTRCRSVVDVGCGRGHWLRVFMRHGVLDALGVDGGYVNRAALHIPRNTFMAWDLSKPLKLRRRFDLCLCLEVAEHLAEECAGKFVASLTALAPFVVFSAAIPGQGGTHHVNEQWQSYWIKLFQGRGFRASDCIRPLIWSNPKVAWWYAQNMFLFVGSNCRVRLGAVRAALVKDRCGIVDVVHPRRLSRRCPPLGPFTEDSHPH